MTDPRLATLLGAAADALDNGCDPLDEGFLADHLVATNEERATLASLLALGARLVSFGLDRPDLAAAALDGTHLAGAPEDLVHSLARWRPLTEQPPPPPRPPMTHHNEALCSNCGRAIRRSGPGSPWWHAYNASSACYPGRGSRYTASPREVL